MTNSIDMVYEIAALAQTLRLLDIYQTRRSGLNILVLLEIAREEGCTSRYLQEKLNVNQSTISRATRDLGGANVRTGRCNPLGGSALIFSYKDLEASRPERPIDRPGRSDRLRYALTETGREKLSKAVQYLSTNFPVRPIQDR